MGLVRTAVGVHPAGASGKKAPPDRVVAPEFALVKLRRGGELRMVRAFSIKLWPQALNECFERLKSRGYSQCETVPGCVRILAVRCPF